MNQSSTCLKIGVTLNDSNPNVFLSLCYFKWFNSHCKFNFWHGYITQCTVFFTGESNLSVFKLLCSIGSVFICTFLNFWANGLGPNLFLQLCLFRWTKVRGFKFLGSSGSSFNVFMTFCSSWSNFDVLLTIGVPVDHVSMFFFRFFCSIVSNSNVFFGPLCSNGSIFNVFFLARCVPVDRVSMCFFELLGHCGEIPEMYTVVCLFYVVYS